MPAPENPDMFRITLLIQEEIAIFVRTQKMNKKTIRILDDLLLEKLKEEVQDDIKL